MEFIPIPANTTILVAVVAVICVIGPIIAAIIAAVRFKTGPMPILLGVLFYFVAQIIVRTPLLNLLFAIPGLGSFLDGNAVLRNITLSLTTAVIEELARWSAFIFVLKKRVNDYTAITYGIGHGGTEAVLTGGLGYINYFITAQAINLIASAEAGVSPTDFYAADILESLLAVNPTIASMRFQDMLSTVILIAAFICMHVLFTFIVARGILYKTTKITLPLAMGGHFLYSAIVSLLQLMPNGTLWATIFAAAIAAACAYYLLEARRRAVMREYEERRR